MKISDARLKEISSWLNEDEIKLIVLELQAARDMRDKMIPEVFAYHTNYHILNSPYIQCPVIAYDRIRNGEE